MAAVWNDHIRRDRASDHEVKPEYDQRKEFDIVLLESLRPFVLGSGIMIVGAAIYLAFAMDSGFGVLGLGLGLTIGAGFLKVYRSLKAGRIPSSFAHPLAAAVSAVGCLLLAFTLITDDNPSGELRIMSLALAVVMAGALYLTWRWLLGMMAFMFTGWIAINLLVGFDFQWDRQISGMVFIGLTTLVGYAVRKRAIIKMIETQKENERQNAQLIDALERAHRSEAELHVERHMANQIVDTMGQGLVLLDHEGAIEYVNNAAEEILGRSTDELGGVPATSVILGSNHEAHPNLRSAIESVHSEEESFEGFIYQPDGSRSTVLVSTVVRPGGGTIVTLTDLTIRKQFEAKLERMANYDALTGLANRAHLIEKIERMARENATRPKQVAILFVDLDRFKQINDTLGHAVGDRVLIECANRIQASIRAGDTAARFGGDEFVILLADLAQDATAIDIADRIVRSIEEPFVLPDSIQRISASVGISFGDTSDLDSEEIIQQADVAMYEAKSNRFTNTIVYQPRPRARIPIVA